MDRRNARARVYLRAAERHGGRNHAARQAAARHLASRRGRAEVCIIQAQGLAESTFVTHLVRRLLRR